MLLLLLLQKFRNNNALCVFVDTLFLSVLFLVVCYPSAAPLGARVGTASLPQAVGVGAAAGHRCLPNKFFAEKTKILLWGYFNMFFNIPLHLALCSFVYSSTLHPILLHVMPFIYVTYLFLVLFVNQLCPAPRSALL